jgi:hypothetical protein
VRLQTPIPFRSVADEIIQVLPVSEPHAEANAQYLITAILRSPLCFSFFFVSFPCHEKPPSSEGGETRKLRPQGGLGRCLLLEVVDEGFSALQTHIENLRPDLLGNRRMTQVLDQSFIHLPGILLGLDKEANRNA